MPTAAAGGECRAGLFTLSAVVARGQEPIFECLIWRQPMAPCSASMMTDNGFLSPHSHEPGDAKLVG